MHIDADLKKKHCAYRKACKTFAALWTHTNILICKYVNKQIL